jgi:ABC-type multidrug transport system fused ATPase/permease subunit
LITEETRVKGTVKKSVYSMYFSAAGGACIIFTVLALFCLAQTIRALNNWWLTCWSNDTMKKKATWYLLIYVILGIFTVISAALAHLVTFFAGLKASGKLHDNLLQGIMRSPMSFFDQTPLGRITNRVSKDIYTVDKIIPNVIASLLSCLFSVIATLVVILIAVPWFIVVIVLLAFYYVYEGRFYMKSSREVKRLDSISRSPIYANFGETLDGTSVIRAYEAQDQFIEKNYKLLDLNQRAYFIISSSNCWLGIRLEFAGTIIIGAASLLAVISKNPANAVFTSMAALAISYSLDTTQALNWVVRMATDMETQIVAVERIEEYSKLPSEAPSHIQETKPKESWPDHGDIIINNLQMRYRPELEPVLRHLSLHILPGEKVGVVGRTGAGKSSLVLCLMRIVELEEGNITIDGIDISKIGLEDLRSKIAIIPQEPLLFSGTVRSNLDPFGQYQDEEIWNSLERSGMKDVIKENPDGLETIVEEHGMNYSVGQRQLLCVSRALLRKSRVILMDEATASIDLETDMKIQKTIRTEFTSSTVITIAHRIHTIIDSDKVLVLEQGELKEYDKPSVLLNDKTSLFSQLVDKSKEVE